MTSKVDLIKCAIDLQLRPASPALIALDTFLCERRALLRIVCIANAPLHGRALGNTGDPLEQVREWGHLLIGEAGAFPNLDPTPRLDVGDAVLALALAGEIVARLAILGVFAAQLNLQHAKDTQSLVSEPGDRVFDLLWRGAGEMVDLAVVSIKRQEVRD